MGRGGIDEGDPASKTASSDHRHHRSSPLEGDAVLLTGVDVFAHLPSQLNEPIPVDPEESLHQRLPKQINDSSVKWAGVRRSCRSSFQIFLRAIFISS
jgi:hypothetical protein